MGCHLLDLVARVGDALGDALVGAYGRCELGVVLDDQLVQIPIALLVRLFQATLLRLPVLDIVAGGECPKIKREAQLKLDKPESSELGKPVLVLPFAED